MVLVETVVIVVNEVPVDSVTEFSEVEPDGLGTGVLVVEPDGLGTGVVGFFGEILEE